MSTYSAYVATDVKNASEPGKSKGPAHAVLPAEMSTYEPGHINTVCWKLRQRPEAMADEAGGRHQGGGGDCTLENLWTSHASLEKKWFLRGPRANAQHQGDYRNHGHGPQEYRLKIDIPNFHGQLHIEDFLDWVQTVDHFFEYMEVPEEKQVTLVAYKLKSDTSAWAEQLQHIRRHDGKGRMRTRQRIKQLLRARYLPSDYEQILYHQIINTKIVDRNRGV
ncbi:hypothetical protein LWI29_034915 [Acer saccharum]|uniref:Retrotransposon gag domain-containing protein n=1 Tax=Acer saccharum TaxID=4024 RepID=A0AA39TB67_ACESA|nr:hypothetical protein LWI29_034915 [Acer saccharum]